jgi:hypothetical protein
MPFENIGQGLKHLLYDSDIDLGRIIDKPNLLCTPALQHVLEKIDPELGSCRSTLQTAVF